jgi:2-polyprenyl-3-methyl-5-hydroxy-6-metoxy-1,4-benzoquinol methylase
VSSAARGPTTPSTTKRSAASPAPSTFKEPPETTSRTDRDALREQVRGRYAAAALKVSSGQADCGCGQPADCGCDNGCCGAATAEDPGFGAELYGTLDRDQLPTAALASLGCGNPDRVADLRPGETVLDLGSGGGMDVLLSAKRVGPSGKAYGLDMTEEMLTLARQNAAQAGTTNVEWLKGHIEAIPLPARPWMWSSPTA